MKSILREFYKSPIHPKIILLIMAIFLVGNCLMSVYWIGRYQADKTSEYLEAYDTVYRIVEGKITQAKMKWLVAEKARLNEIIQGGEFSVEADSEGTYTGYVYSDNNLINGLYADARYAFEYATYAQGITEKAEEAATLYTEKGSYDLAEYYTVMAKQFRGRQITSFFRTYGWEEYFSYGFSSLVLLLMITLVVSAFFSQERETGMDALLEITPHGLRRALIEKLISAFAFTTVLTFLISLLDYLVFLEAFGLRGLNCPLYALSAFQQTSMNITILEYVLLNFALKLQAMYTFTGLILWCSASSKSSNLHAFGKSLGVIAVEILLSAFFPLLSFLPLCNSIDLCADFAWNRMIELPQVVISWILQVLVCVLASAAACWQGVARTKGKIRWVIS